MRTDETMFVERLKSLAKIEEPSVVREELAGIRPEDIAEAFPRLSTEDALMLLRHLDEVTASNLLVELPTETARALIAELPDATLAHYLDILPMDDAMELREELPEDRFEALLNVIPREDALEIRRLMAYPEGSVGRLMTEDFVEARPDQTMAQVLRDIREKPEEEYETVNDIYVLDENRHLLGVFSLRRAVRARPNQTAAEMMLADVITVPPDTSAEEAARQIARYGFYAMPVVDRRGRMVGIFTVDDAQEILAEADTEDVLKLGGVSGNAEAYLSLSVVSLVRRRLPWLLILFVAEIFTGSVLRHYAAIWGGGSDPVSAAGLASYAQLVVFVPLLIGAGGNAGSQVTTTITRALAVGDVRLDDTLAVIRREFAVALIIGATLGFLGFLRAFFGWTSGFDVSLVVGLALPCIVVWATVFGSLLPMAAKRLGLDPAVLSAPFITTFVDATGLIIYFEVAAQILNVK